MSGVIRSLGAALRGLAGILFCAAIALPASARQPASFRFDQQAIVDPPLQFEFQRGVSALADDGTWVGPNQPRYRAETLLAPMPEIVTVPGTTASPTINLIAAGVAEDGVTPVWVVAEFSKVRLQVYVGSLPGPCYEYSMHYNPAKDGLMDFLDQSIDDQSSEAWRPVSGVVCHGMIILQCNVAVPGPSGWNSNRIGFATCRVADLAGPTNKWWRRHSVSDALSPQPSGIGLGAFWSMPTWWSMERDGAAPVKAWIAASDYHSAPKKDGGTYVVFPIQRSSPTSTDWTASPVVELPGRWVDPTFRSHAHAIGLTRYGEHGMLALGARGDSLGNGVDYTWTLDNEADFDAGAIPAPTGYNWLQAGPTWNGPVVAHGTLEPTLTNFQARNKGNQFIAIAPGPNAGTFLCGSDEVSETLWQTTDLSSPGAVLSYTTPYRLAQTLPLIATGSDGPWRHYLCFHLRTPTPNLLNGAYVGQLSPSQNDMDGWNNQRVIYSPDGQRWCQVWTHFEGVQSPVWLVDGRIWTGSYGKHGGAGVRSIAVPDLVSARPLTVAPGGRNAASLTPTFSGGGLGVTIAANPALPAGISPPPCVGPWYRIQNQPPTPATGSYDLGTFRLATGIPANVREVTAKVWVRQDAPSEAPLADSLLAMGRFKTSDASGSTASTKSSVNSASIEIASAGQWIPVIFTSDLSTWAHQENWGSSGGNLDLVLSSAWNFAAPTSFYMAVESVSWAPSPPYVSQVDAHLPAERAEITGFSMPDTWTVFVAGKIPDASWDNSSTAYDSQTRPLFSVISQTGLSWVDVLAGRAQSEIILQPGGLAAGTPISITSYNCWPGSPVYLAVSYCSQYSGFILRGTVGNSTVRSTFATYGGFDSPASRIRFGSGDGQRIAEFDIFGGAIVPGEATEADAKAVFQTLPMLRGLAMPAMTGDCEDMYNGPCAADFDQSGFLDTDDFDGFVQAFELGVDEADFDQSGFVDTDDFDKFVVAFEKGC